VQRLNWGDERPDKARRGRWTPQEIALLKDLYGLRNEAEIARELNRTPASVRRKAQSLFETAAKRHGPWTSKEVQKLKEYLGATVPDVIARILGRHPEEVHKQIFKLGRIRHGGRWTSEETRRFKRIYGTRSNESLALIFGRSEQSIKRHAESLHLGKDKAFLGKVQGKGTTRMPRWSEQELELLGRLYPTTPNLEIAEQLDRSIKSVVSKAHYMGLRKDIERLREMGRQNVSVRYRESR
jgi:hypothetical protein